ncbi:hypothetical protein PAMP_001276 [Pampus punctatissimus]
MSDHDNNIACSSSQREMEEVMTKTQMDNLIKLKEESEKLEPENRLINVDSQTEMEEVMKKIARQKRVQHRQCLILEEIKLKVENEKLERENLLINEKYVQISHELDDMQRETTVHVECAQSSNDYILQLYVSKVPVVKQLQEELDRLQENIQNDDNIEKSIQEAELYKTPLLEEISTEEGERTDSSQRKSCRRASKQEEYEWLDKSQTFLQKEGVGVSQILAKIKEETRASKQEEYEWLDKSQTFLQKGVGVSPMLVKMKEEKQGIT